MSARRTDERGSAMIIALAVLTIGLLLGVAAVGEAVVSRHGADRDTATKQALQAADAGVQAAIDNMNRMAVDESALKCVARGDGNVLTLVAYDASLNGDWCPEVSEQLADGRSFRYRVSKAVTVTGSQVTLDRTVVAHGRSGGVQRRVAAKVSALTGAPLFSSNALISLRQLTMPNSARVTGNVRSNEGIALTNSALVCGNATPGPGHAVTGPEHVSCGGSTAAAPQQLVLSPIDQGNAATVNDNGRVCAADPCTSRPKIDWSTSTRRLILSNNSSVTLGGSVYSFCQLELRNNSSLIIPVKQAGTSVRIFIDAPENCPAGSGGFLKENGADIVNLNGDPVTLQVYVLGSTQQETTVSFTNNSAPPGGLPMVIYAPNSTVSLVNYARIRGAVAARSVVMGNNVAVDYAESVSAITTSAVVPLYRRQQYRECPPTVAAGGTPDSGC